jgi:bifunctional DNA-binding transcriptional regulator/antitoxin component of YhaV-PrlF toxin-antitoxin module
MKALISMDGSGRLVIPKKIRQSLKASRDAIFQAEVIGNHLELTLAEPDVAKLHRKGKLLVVAKQGIEVDALKAVEETREEAR